ncbi:MAG: hypothetical protein QXJ96_02425 [Candidatus Aenigmatarchaeota archaeon]|nr:hypothetical protein [Candidatus Aenigmarchaeota archaeon]
MSRIKYFIFKKILNFFAILFLIIIFLTEFLAFACEPMDARFSLVIGDLNIDFERLQSICTASTCKYFGKDIILKSDCDDRVAIIISAGEDFIKNRIIIKLPYKIEEDRIIEGEINPEDFDWKGCVKKELENLRNAEIISISEREIEIISSLAEAHKNILLCNNSWESLNANCNCDACFRCLSQPNSVTLPEKSLLAYSGVSDSSEDNSKNQFIFFIFAMVIVLCFVVAILLFFTRVPPYE